MVRAGVRPDISERVLGHVIGGVEGVYDRHSLGASGGYEGVVAVALAEVGLPVAIVNPRQVRKFAGAIGQLPKTDAIDAAVIAHFAQAVRPGRDGSLCDTLIFWLVFSRSAIALLGPSCLVEAKPTAAPVPPPSWRR